MPGTPKSKNKPIKPKTQYMKRPQLFSMRLYPVFSSADGFWPLAFWLLGSGYLLMVNGQWSMVNGQWSMELWNPGTIEQ
jgi:hypothetical protein